MYHNLFNKIHHMSIKVASNDNTTINSPHKYSHAFLITLLKSQKSDYLVQ